MKAEFTDSLPPCAKEYDESKMYRDGKLSQDFIKVSTPTLKQTLHDQLFRRVSTVSEWIHL